MNRQHLDENDQRLLNDLLYSEVIRGKPNEQTVEKMRAFIEKLKDMGCDSFIAGCTEIPILIEDESDSPLPFTTRLLAKRALERALAP